jgi:prevent-host-death family protein
VDGRFLLSSVVETTVPGELMGEHAIDLRQAQSRLAELVQEAVRGEEVILTDGGEPVAKIIPIDRAQGPREFGSARGLIHMADDFDAPLEEFREYM